MSIPSPDPPRFFGQFKSPTAGQPSSLARMGTSTGLIGAANDNSEALFSTTFSANVAGSPTQLTARINGQRLTSVRADHHVVPGAFSLANSIVSVAQARFIGNMNS